MDNLYRQRGLSLFVVMIILPILTILGVVVVTGTFTDLKMSGARLSHHQSDITLDAISEEILSNANSLTRFASADDNTTFTSTHFASVTSQTNINDEGDCKRRKEVSDNDFSCRYIEVKFSHRFGKKRDDGQNWGLNELAIGVEQPLLAN